MAKKQTSFKRDAKTGKFMAKKQKLPVQVRKMNQRIEVLLKIRLEQVEQELKT
jgi:hypothetical protein